MTPHRPAKIISLLLIFSLFLTGNTPCISTESTGLSWQERWVRDGAGDASRVMLTPGSTPADLNFCWYSENPGSPAVKISKDDDFQSSRLFRGTVLEIDRSSETTHYQASHRVSVTDFFQKNKTYYYRYTNDITASPVKWSYPRTYSTRDTKSFCALLIGDAQIGASGDIASDTETLCRTLEQAEQTAPDAAFLLSAGDQIDYKTDQDEMGLRESQYAGFTYPDLFRSLPVAAAIGNHETKGTDYKYHFYNPQSVGNPGATPSGCDYYFRYGNALFLVLNSNSRDSKSHRKFMKKAIQKNGDAKWRIVLFHHDIYGSGAAHSNRTGANMRIFFAPLMDEFVIDVVFTGHDHSYARSYSMLDGTAIDGDTKKGKDCALKNPPGTTYFTLGTSSGSKTYDLASPRQFYVAERKSGRTPTFSTFTVTAKTLKVKTYDYNGKKFAGDFILKKTEKKKNPAAEIQKIQTKKLKKYEKKYAKKSVQKLKKALKAYRRLFRPTARDKGAEKAARLFDKKNDPLSYYGYAAGTADALPDGFSMLLDKTRKQQIKISVKKFRAAVKRIKKAEKQLL